MELQELIQRSSDLSKQLEKLKAHEAEIKAELKTLESDIKTKLDKPGEEYSNLSEEEFQLMMKELSDPMMLSVEVVYITNEAQHISEVQLQRGATIEDGIVVSGILDKCKEIDLTNNKVGVYGTVKPLTESVYDGDRIEIYRQLAIKE